MLNDHFPKQEDISNSSLHIILLLNQCEMSSDYKYAENENK